MWVALYVYSLHIINDKLEIIIIKKFQDSEVGPTNKSLYIDYKIQIIRNCDVL